MKIPLDFKPLYLSFKKRKWQWKPSEELFKNINVTQKNNLYLYNYGDAVLVERNHPTLVKWRGVVVDENVNVLNFPFERFFNDFEKEKADVDWQTAIVQEKLDGSLVCVFWTGTEWEVTTRGSFYPNPRAELNFKELFKQHFKSFNKLEKENCYVFELMTFKNRIVTWYDKEQVFLLTARNLTTLKEKDNLELNEIAKALQVNRPRHFDASDLKHCKQLLEQLRDDEEGVVIVDSKFNRIKVKKESYLRLSKIKMLNEQDLFEYALGKTQIDVEYLEKCPEVFSEVKNIRAQWNDIVKKAENTFKEIKKSSSSRKEFALSAVKYPYRTLLFKILDGKSVTELKLEWKIVKEWE